MITKDIGYIRVNQFKETTHTEMEKALQTLKKEGMNKLILDLRDNGGGYLEEAVRMADQFLAGGPADNPHRIVYTKSRKPDFEESYSAKTGDAYEKIPLIVLINNASASASEIVAGALQDWDRALIVGETSFGKGLVQRQFPLRDGSAFRLTVARYYTPSGRLIQRSYQGKDKDEYQMEAFQRDEQEGDNLEHTHDAKSVKASKNDGQQSDSLEQKQDAKPDTTIPVFKTADGRKVLGGGGITPDYVVKSEKVTGVVQTVRRQNLFYDFCKNYMEGPGFVLRAKYSKNFEEYKMKYTISDGLTADFRKYIESKQVKVDEKEYLKDLDFMKAYLKAQIAQMIFGLEGWIGVMVGVDNQIQKALTLFPEAEKIANLK
jgi:carboxyl-terminal processing protease